MTEKHNKKIRRLSKDQKLYGCKGTYFLDIIDDEIYSTNDYTAYFYYNLIFRGIDVHEEHNK